MIKTKSSGNPCDLQKVNPALHNDLGRDKVVEREDRREDLADWIGFCIKSSVVDSEC